MSVSLDLITTPQLRRAVPPAVTWDNVSLQYQSGNRTVTAVENIRLEIGTGKFVAVVGPTGCGKSTLLHLACGILQPTQGQVRHFGKPLQELATKVGYVSQTDGLLAWKTVAANIGLPLRLQRRPEEEIREQVELWLRRTGLARFANAYPSHLSGGMRKRVALAQALIHHPKLVLMDEPLSALDVQTRTLIGSELLGLWERLGNTMMLVTHDLEEAIGMADEVVVITSRPARVKAVYPINLPRPRDLAEIRTSRDFQHLYAAIWEDLREEVRAAHADHA